MQAEKLQGRFCSTEPAPRPTERCHAQTQQRQGAQLWHAVAYRGGGYCPVGENEGGGTTRIKSWLPEKRTAEPEAWIIGVWEQNDADSVPEWIIFAWCENDTGRIATAKNLVRLVTKTTNDLVKQRLVRGNGIINRVKVKVRIHTTTKQAVATAVHKADVVSHRAYDNPYGTGKLA